MRALVVMVMAMGWYHLHQYWWSEQHRQRYHAASRRMYQGRLAEIPRAATPATPGGSDDE